MKEETRNTRGRRKSKRRRTLLLNYENEITSYKCPNCNTVIISGGGRAAANRRKCTVCGFFLPENAIKTIENHKKKLQSQKESPGFKSQNKLTTFKSYLKIEARIMLNNLNNYLIRVHHSEPSTCKFCDKRIAQPSLPLTLWNKDQIHFIENHVQCIISKENLKEFNDFVADFDYNYEIDE